MNKFVVKTKKSDGNWYELDAKLVFPFSWGELLDERLDEAYITVYDSKEQTYKRLSELEITITTNLNTKIEASKAYYFIIASDNSVELPIGSGLYKHEIYLIERTKLLEGIHCSSITFTNVKTHLFGSSNASWRDLRGTGDYSNGFYKVPLDIEPRIPNIVKPGDILISPFKLAENIYPVIKRYWQSDVPIQVNILSGACGCTYQSNSVTKVYNSEQSPTISESGSITLTYVLVFETLGTDNTFYTRKYAIEFQIASIENELPLKRWSITDCIKRVCELAEPIYDETAAKYRFDGIEYDNYGNLKPYKEGSFAEKYDKIEAPEFSLTEDNLREQLKVILSYVHAEPYLDENDVIYPLEYGNTTKSKAENYKCVYNAASCHINEYCTEIRSHAQNIVASLGYANGVITDPGKNIYRSVRSDTAYVRINEENAEAKTNLPIYSIESVYCGIAKSDGTGWERTPVDITPYVFEQTEYSANLSSYAGAYPYSKQYAIYYTQGAPNLKGLFYKCPDSINSAVFSNFAISNIIAKAKNNDTSTPEIIDKLLVKDASSLVFSISYKPISNHFVSHGKQLYVKGEVPYAQLYNQSENLVESQYYGEHIKGVAARLGNIEKERTFILKSLDDIPRVGEMLGEYAISAVSCELYPFDIKCTVGLSKDFNRISEYVGINSQKRMYEISERSATNRDVLIKETLVISESVPENLVLGNFIFENLNPFRYIFAKSKNYENHEGKYKINLAKFTGKSFLKNTIANNVYIPVISRSIGNAITFNFAMQDNYSAGTKTQYIESSNGEIQGRWETDVCYTDYYGRVYFADVSLYGGDIGGPLDDGRKTSLAYNIPLGNVELAETTEVAKLPYPHLLRKDNRERISYNIELEIKTDKEDLIIGSALADLCRWVNDANYDSPVIYYFDAEKYSIGKFDKILSLTRESVVGGYSVKTDGVADYDAVELTIKKPSEGERYGWAICMPFKNTTETVENERGEIIEQSREMGGEIILASNTPLTENLTLKFYVVNY